MLQDEIKDHIDFFETKKDVIMRELAFRNDIDNKEPFRDLVAEIQSTIDQLQGILNYYDKVGSYAVILDKLALAATA